MASCEQKWLSEFVQVNVAELRDTETVESWGEARQRNVVLRELDPVPLNLTSIECQARACARTPK